MPSNWKTREVLVGNIGVGGKNPIRIQSMTTSSTRDAKATIDQIMRLADYGCEIARVTVQGMKEADTCEEIKNGLLRHGYDIPLVADIHFFPPAAMRVVDFVDKVRVNPGNYVDKRATFKVIEYDDATYAAEIERLEEKFTPLVEKCKRLKRAMRIGTNHGSLSDRIMNRYGDTPMGMVESAFEFTRVCRKLGYHDIIYSMKASNPQVMIEAYRLLVAEMLQLGWDYPLHLGVTEAGEGEDGRIKSAMGTGSLLLDGIGDTIRVSLTEDPWYEIDPCQRLIRLTQERTHSDIDPLLDLKRKAERRTLSFPRNVSLHRDGSVLVKVEESDLSSPTLYPDLGLEGTSLTPKLGMSCADAIYLPSSALNNPLQPLQEIGVGVLSLQGTGRTTPLFSLSEAITHQKTESFSLTSPTPYVVRITDNDPSEQWNALLSLSPAYLLLSPSTNRVPFCRRFFHFVEQHTLPFPVILHFSYTSEKEDTILEASMEAGSLFCDKWGEGLLLDTPHGISFNRILAFGILQAARMRTFKTEFISCPSCGRTLFDLQEVTKKIHARTSHLPGVKIAIMGCIVNGPGEMADADFGYVGSKPGMIDLYVGKQCVEKSIPFDQADDRLVNLIKAHNRWVDPVTTNVC